MILTFDHPALLTPCAPLQAEDSLSFLLTMRLCIEHHRGLGLAANQIGVLKRALLLRPRKFTRVLLNPVLIRASKEQYVDTEGCLSYPGVLVPVSRSIMVEVDYYDEHWKVRRDVFHYVEARIIQHELEHLDGRGSVGDVWRSTRK